MVRRCYVGGMKLADQVAQCRTPFVIQTCGTGDLIRLDNAAECAPAVAAAPIRFVLSDDLTRLCAALAYSKGARTLDCADLVRVPAETVWVEWCREPWERELERYGFPRCMEPGGGGGRRGAKAALLEHIDVSAPILPGYARWGTDETAGVRKSPRLHHVRGHLVRRGSELFWRVPHLRGSASLGSVRTRTVTWTVDGSLRRS